LRNRKTFAPATRLRLLTVERVEEHAAEPDDGGQDVQHEHELVGAAVDVAKHSH
jgi:hypothetical protein